MVVQRRARRPRGRRAPDAASCAAWATRSTSRSPTSPRTSAHPRRARPRSSSCRTGSRSRRRLPRSAGAPRRRRCRRLGVARRELDAERRALDRLEPRAQLAASRERAGLLLDRAARVVTERLAAAQRGQERLAARLLPVLPARLDLEARRLDALGVRAPRVVQLRLATATASLAATRASLGALGPAGDARPRLRDRPAGRRRRHRAPARRCAGRHAASASRSPTGRLAATSDGPHPTTGQGRRGERATTSAGPSCSSWSWRVFVTVGVVVGMIAAGRIDRLMAPRPRPRPDDEPAPTSPAAPGQEDPS